MPRQIAASAVVAAPEAEAFWSLVPRSASGGVEPAGVHPVHACSIVGVRVSEVLHDHFGGAPVIHLGQSVRSRGPIAVGDDLEIEAQVTQVTPKPAGTVLEIAARVACRGRRVLDSRALLLATSVEGAAPDGGDVAARWASAGPRAGQTLAWRDAVHYALTETEIARFGLCTGDDQAIHLSNDVARAAGLPGVIAHGMHTVASCYQAAADEAHRARERIRDLTIRFARPVLPGTPVVVQVGRLPHALAVRTVSRGRALTRGGLATVTAAGPVDPSGAPSPALSLSPRAAGA
jgi:acyl dehydratase